MHVNSYKLKGRSQELARIMILLGLVAMGVFCFVSDQSVASVASLVLFAAYLLYIAFERTAFFVKYFFVVFGVTLNIAGCAVCEFADIYLFELQKFSGFSGSLPLLILCNCFLMFIIERIDAFWAIEVNCSCPQWHSQNIFVTLMTVFVAGICAVLLFRVIDSPSFLLGQDRFEYKAIYLSGIWDHVVTVLQYLVVFPLMSLRKGDKALGIVSLVLYCVFFFWIGHKFGTFFHVFVMALFVYYDVILALSRRNLKRITTAILVALSVLVCFTVFAHSFTSEKATDEYLFQRAAQQGQLWWGVYKEYPSASGQHEFRYEVEALGSGEESPQNSIGNRNGIYGAMYLVAPSDVVDAKLKTGSMYTECGFAMAYYYGGAVGILLFAVVMAVLLSTVTNLLILSIWNESIVGMVLLTRLYRLVLSAWGCFFFARLLGLTSLISYIVLLILFCTFTSRKARSHYAIGSEYATSARRCRLSALGNSAGEPVG